MCSVSGKGGPLKPCVPEIRFFRPTPPVLYDQSLGVISLGFKVFHRGRFSSENLVVGLTVCIFEKSDKSVRKFFRKCLRICISCNCINLSKIGYFPTRHILTFDKQDLVFALRIKPSFFYPVFSSSQYFSDISPNPSIIWRTSSR